MLSAALDGKLDGAGFHRDPVFGVQVPNSCPNIPSTVLDPRNTWKNPDDYDKQARDLTHRFEKNFKQFETSVTESVKAAAIQGIP